MRRRVIHSIALALIAAGLGTTLADDVPPPAPGLATARQEYDALVKKNETDFIRAQIIAKQRYLQSVENALKAQTRAGNLDAANAVNDEKKEIEQDIADLKAALASGDHVGIGGIGGGAKKDPAQLTIDAKKGWQQVVHLKKGQIIHVKAEGTWHTYGPQEYACDAEGIRNGKETYPFTKTALPGALIGKLGNNIFLLGKSARIVAPEEGDLEVRINKRDDYLHDDSGQLTVTLRRGDTSTVDKSEHQIK